MKRALALLLLPLPILLISVSIPKLSGMYDRPLFFVPLGAAVGLSFLAVLLHALRALPGPSGAARTAWLAALSIAAALVTAWIFRTNPDPKSALRESVHILEYGALGVLTLGLLRNGARRLGPWGYPMTLIYAAAVGIADELVQFYHPGRVGDLRDVKVDLGATTLGLLLARQVLGTRFPPQAAPRTPALALAATAGLGALALSFVALVDTGYAIRDPSCGTFHSRMRPDELDARTAAEAPEAVRRRQEREARKPILAIEDPFLTEARGHMLHRNIPGSPRQAAMENAILEHHFGAALDGLRGRFSPQQIAAVAADRSPEGYVSPYLRDLRTRPEPAVLAGLALVAAAAGVALAAWALR